MNRSDISQMIEETRKHITVGERAVVPGMLMRFVGFGQVMCGFWNSCRRVWWMIRMRDAYTSENFFSLVAGHGMGLILEDSKIVKMASMAVLIAARLLASVDQYGKLRDSWDRFLLAWRGHLESPVEISWEKTKRSCWSTSVETRFFHTIKARLQRVQRIFMAFFKVIKEAFVLSMRMTDSLESFYCSPETRNESLNLFFVNGAFLIDQLTKNQEQLVDELQKNKEVINRMFTKLHSNLTVDRLMQYLPKQKTQTHNAQKKTVPELRDFWVKAKFMMASWVGLEKHVEIPWIFEEDPVKEKKFFIEDECITRPSVLLDRKSY